MRTEEHLRRAAECLLMAVDITVSVVVIITLIGLVSGRLALITVATVLPVLFFREKL